ncbi:MAG: hypothetical protein J7L54_03075 [Elusimicrobia bacterium]|nr:hypothetical protein [Elusimicrobiota bacterium]
MKKSGGKNPARKSHQGDKVLDSLIMAAGADAVMFKPLKKKELREMLDDILQISRFG